MSSFSAGVRSEAVVPADPARIWAALTDPELLPRLTPLLVRIDTDGDLWRWHLTRISALGVGISPVFTERMRFEPMRRIDYTHAPPAGAREQAGVEGSYRLTETGAGTHLAVELTMRVELPLPRAAAPAVQGVMRATMARTGDRFSQNLLRHLGA
ncbi:MAG TPA: SRPBCC family protein [Jatrophihabitans sp.]|nr:SRPBCC family protein [Jatrophihabitans sp.]